MITTKSLALELCKAEGKTRQVNIAQMSEIVKVLRVLLRNKKPSAVVGWVYD